MSNIDIAELSVEQLNKLKADIEVATGQRRQTELMELRGKIDNLVDNSPFALEEILEAKKMRKPVAPKYRNPGDESLTWTGRGRRPRWVDECLANGKTLEDLAI